MTISTSGTNDCLTSFLRVLEQVTFNLAQDNLQVNCPAKIGNNALE